MEDIEALSHEVKLSHRRLQYDDPTLLGLQEMLTYGLKGRLMGTPWVGSGAPLEWLQGPPNQHAWGGSRTLKGAAALSLDGSPVCTAAGPGLLERPGWGPGRSRMRRDGRGVRRLCIQPVPAGMAAYADHAAVYGKNDPEVDKFMMETLAFLASAESADRAKVLDMCIQLGKANLGTMLLLDKAHTDEFGHPVPHKASADGRTCGQVPTCLLTPPHPCMHADPHLAQEGQGHPGERP